MWQSTVSLPLLSVLVLVAVRYWHHLGGFCRSVFSGGAGKGSGRRGAVQLTHSFVLMNSTHGQPDSVLQTFDLYAQTQPSLSIGKEKGEFVDCVVHRVAPTCALELGTHCGYTAIRILRRLPSSAKLYTVEQDPATAEAGEEMILVAGFKHSQFQMLISPSSAAIPRMRAELGVRAVGLVLMDHDVEQYLPDLQALEQEGLVSTGSVLLVNNTHAQGARDFLRYIHSNPRYSVHSQRHGMLEVQCQQGSIDGTR